MSDPIARSVRLKGDILDSLLCRLSEAGFEHLEPPKGGQPLANPWLWINSNPESAIQKLELVYDVPGPSKWLLLTVHTSRPDQVEPALARLYQSADVVSDQDLSAGHAHELNEAQEYWKQTIGAYKGTETRSVAEWFVAQDAIEQLRQASERVQAWNRNEGEHHCPVEAALPDLKSDEFRPPELITKDADLVRQLETVSDRTDLPPNEAAERKLADLRARRRLSESLLWPQMTIAPDLLRITINEIVESNRSNGIPLLPPILSEEDPKQIVLDYLHKRDGAQDEIDDCRRGGVWLQRLCALRRARFDDHGHHAALLEAIRKPVEQPDQEKATPANPVVEAVHSLQSTLKEHLRKTSKTQDQLQRTQAALRNVKAAAALNLREALEKWMRFDPKKMKANTKARIEKAVKMYATDSEKRSLTKIAREFRVTPKTVSTWFSQFSQETGFPVVTFAHHEPVRAHLEADSEAKRQHGEAGESCDAEDTP